MYWGPDPSNFVTRDELYQHIRWIVIFILICFGLSHCGGCIPRQRSDNHAPFQTAELEACLGVLIDGSGSFEDVWKTKGHKLFLQIVDLYFTESQGADTKVVIGSLSGSQEVILFEGKPSDLRQRFQTPEELARFLKEKADPRSSNVLDATRRMVDYLRSTSGVIEGKTRLMTVVMSDMVESEPDARKKAALSDALVSSLKAYGEQKAAIGFYFVAESEKERVYELLRRSEFPSSHYIVEGELSASPQLPKFD